MDTDSAVRRARTLLKAQTPLLFDCGGLCSSACCRASEAGTGMLLFPGEEALYRRLPGGFALQTAPEMPGAALLTCGGACSRAQRPLACRFFPLLPMVRREKGRHVLLLGLDRRAWPVCPLMESGFKAFSPGFLDACRRAARALFEQAEQRAFLMRLYALNEQYKLSLWEDKTT